MSEADVADQDTTPFPRAGSQQGTGTPGPVHAGSSAYRPGNAGQDSVPAGAGLSELPDRPPEHEVSRRVAEREYALSAKPLLGQVLQTLIAVFFPLVLLIGAVRAVTTHVFLWVEYHRPGFPADRYGFSTDDRVTYGSHVMDYLLNFAGPRYLAELVDASGNPLFLAREVSHMADVKVVMLSSLAAGAVLAVLGVAAGIYLARHYKGGIRRGLFAGSAATIVLIAVIGTLGVLNWERFFAGFHALFFASGTWTFYVDDTLIRLFPGRFWMDAGIVIAALVLLASLLVLILTWPTRARRERSAAAQSKLVFAPDGLGTPAAPDAENRNG